MGTHRHTASAFAALLAAGLLAAVAPASAQPGMGPPQDAVSLKSDLACDSCHASTLSVPGAPPLAPAWGDIAQRWRRVPGAERKLADIIVGGSNKRHWEGRAMFDSMLPHAPWVTPDDARTLARWVMQQPKEKP